MGRVESCWVVWNFNQQSNINNASNFSVYSSPSITKWLGDEFFHFIIKMLTLSFQIFAYVNILSYVTSIQNFRVIRLLEKEIEGEGDENILPSLNG